MRLRLSIVLVLAACAKFGAVPSNGTISSYDTIIRHGTVYDGTGKPGIVTDVGLIGDSIAAIGDLSSAKTAHDIEARGMAVTPGFINMMDHSEDALIADGHAQSAIRQGVTLAVMGEGDTPGPVTDTMKKVMLDLQGDIKYPIEWTTLGEYLAYLERRGISTNVASLVGATTV